MQTLLLLSHMLGVHIDTEYAKDDVHGLAATIWTLAAPAELALKHKMIAALAGALLGKEMCQPDKWPDDCFDRVWLIDRCGASVRLAC